MSIRSRVAIFSATLLLLSFCRGQEVVRCPNQQAPLSERWSWATRDGRQAARGEEFWVGYSIKRLMNDDSYISSGSSHARWSENLPTLRDIITGTRSPRPKPNERWETAARPNVIKVLKDIAILLRLRGDGASPGSIQKVELSDLDLNYDARGIPLIWLGASDEDQSVRLLSGQFDRLSSTQAKKQSVTAVGLHQNSSLVYPFLSKILKSQESDDVRSQSAFWIGQQEVPQALGLLVDVARTDGSAKVREQAVFAVSQLRSDETTDALIELARKGPDSKTRGKAAFWLGQKASQKAVTTLEDIVADDNESDVQRQALFALSQTHTSDVVDRLIRIAETHPNPRIRRQAVQLLGQSDDPKALDALIKIVRK